MIKKCKRKFQIVFLLIILLFFSNFCKASEKKRWLIGYELGMSYYKNTYGRIIFIRGGYFYNPDNSVILDFGIFLGSHKSNYGGYFTGIKYRFNSKKSYHPLSI